MQNELAMKLKKIFQEKGYSLRYDSYTNQQLPILPDSHIEKLKEKYVFEFWEKVSDTENRSQILHKLGNKTGSGRRIDKRYYGMLENQMESDKMHRNSGLIFRNFRRLLHWKERDISDAWSLKSLEETWNQKNAAIFAAKTKEKEWQAIFVTIYYVLDEGEIARIATAHSMRRQGAAGQMFQELVAFCRGTADNKNHVGSKRRQRSRQKIL